MHGLDPNPNMDPVVAHNAHHELRGCGSAWFAPQFYPVPHAHIAPSD